MILVLLLTILVLIVSTPNKGKASDCKDGYWIRSKSDDGEIIILNDGSVWQALLTVDTMLWMRLDKVIICNLRGTDFATMINIDEDAEKADVKRLK